MATITDTGITPTTLEEYITALENIFKSVFGNDFNVDPETPQGQLVGNIAFSLSQSDDAHVLTAGTLDIFKASNTQLEGLCSLLGITKRGASNTTVTADFAGVSATLIPAGTRARSTGGDLFALNEDATLSGAGTVSSTMTAVESGAIELGVGELTQVVDVVPGWETIDNAAEGSIGQPSELDMNYRGRYFDQLFKNAVSVLDAILAEVRQVDNVVEAYGAENDTDSAVTIDGVSVAAHSIAIVVDGGTEEEIKDAIRLKKTGGTGTVGTTAVADSPHTDINYYKVTKIEIEVNVTISIASDYPGNGTELLKQRIYDYIAGTLELSADSSYFEMSGMTISEDLYQFRLYTPINSVPGHTVSALSINVKGSGAADPITADLNEKIIIDSLDDISITIV